MICQIRVKREDFAERSPVIPCLFKQTEVILLKTMRRWFKSLRLILETTSRLSSKWSCILTRSSINLKIKKRKLLSLRSKSKLLNKNLKKLRIIGNLRQEQKMKRTTLLKERSKIRLIKSFFLKKRWRKCNKQLIKASSWKIYKNSMMMKLFR